MTKMDIARKFALEYREQLESGQISKKQVARLMMEAYPLDFKDVETARKTIRAATGCGGNPDHVPAFKFKSTIAHGLQSVKSKALPPEILHIDGVRKIAVLSDIHIPYHSEEALEVAVHHAIKEGCQDVLINGDLIDCYQLSRYDKDPRKTSMLEEMQMVGTFLELIHKTFSGTIWWKFGNHEERFDSYILNRAPELLGIPTIDLASLVIGESDLPRLNMVGGKTIMKVGKLNVIHGHEFGHAMMAPVNPARGLFLRAKCSSLCGHHHQTSEHHENDLNDTAIACWTVGGLCELNPGYRPFAFTKWNHGLAVIDLEEDGSFTVENRRIINGKVR